MFNFINQDYYLNKSIQTHIETEISEKCSMCLAKNSRYLVMADTKAAKEGRFAGLVCRIQGRVD